MKFEFESGCFVYFTFVFVLFGELRLVMSWCVGGRYSMAGSNEDRGRSRRPGDEDINTLATIIPSVEIVGPITRSRAQELNHQVNSFLCSSTYNIESRLLPNDLIILRNH
jgi:hypothetical protein